jgi:hypothetical protein
MEQGSVMGSLLVSGARGTGPGLRGKSDRAACEQALSRFQVKEFARWEALIESRKITVD